ncbi:MAG TPA: ClpXP protease specificity-enhancing factor SspB [Alphaproteobacteria bacterium]|jgi:hypothetical protein|nr:ClpXP protease specificity-enhancing factor SspB [Alphaproteobacteria bacterium]
MAKEILQYSVMVEAALRAVVRQALAEVGQNGLPGNHHFYITFRTSHPGVQVPDYLKARYPSEMTIVLQFQFYDLEVDDTAFSVTLTFNNNPERLIIPLRAITVFADPSVNFVLPFQATDAVPVEEPPAPKAAAAPAIVKPVDAKEPEDGDKGAQVVSLDKFRKK